MKTNSYTCIWWNGGTAIGRWQRCNEGSRDHAEQGKADCERMGFLAKVIPTETLRHGLPTTRLPEERAEDWTPGYNGFYWHKDYFQGAVMPVA